MNGSNGRTENSSKLSQSFDNRRNYAIETVCLILLGYAIVPCWGSTMLIEKKHETPMHKVELTQKGYIQVRKFGKLRNRFIFFFTMRSTMFAKVYKISVFQKGKKFFSKY